MALMQQMEGGKWVPLITLLCPVHNAELTSNAAEVEVSEWQCTVGGCSVSVLVRSDRERLKNLKLAAPD